MKSKRYIVGLVWLSLMISLAIPHAAFAGRGLPSDSASHTTWAILGAAAMGLVGLVLQTALQMRHGRQVSFRASDIRDPAPRFHLTLILSVGKTIAGLAARLGLILAEVCLLILGLLLFDIVWL